MEAIYFRDLPHEAQAELIDENDHDIDADESLSDLICSMGDENQTSDSDYLYSTYTLESNNWRFEASGSQYKKDGGLCEFELHESVTVTDLKVERAAKTEQDEIEQNKWRAFLTTASVEEIFEKVKHFKFV